MLQVDGGLAHVDFAAINPPFCLWKSWLGLGPAWTSNPEDDASAGRAEEQDGRRKRQMEVRGAGKDGDQAPCSGGGQEGPTSGSLTAWGRKGQGRVGGKHG
eukprot:766636-Hanusia_phi.AAC.6